MALSDLLKKFGKQTTNDNHNGVVETQKSTTQNKIPSVQQTRPTVAKTTTTYISAAQPRTAVTQQVFNSANNRSQTNYTTNLTTDTLNPFTAAKNNAPRQTSIQVSPITSSAKNVVSTSGTSGKYGDTTKYNSILSNFGQSAADEYKQNELNKTTIYNYEHGNKAYKENNASNYQKAKDSVMENILKKNNLTANDFISANKLDYSTSNKLLKSMKLNASDEKYMRDYVARQIAHKQTDLMKAVAENGNAFANAVQTISTFPTNAVNSITNTIDKAINYVSGNPINVESQASILADQPKEIRQAISNKIDNPVGNFAYNMANSMGDMGTAALVNTILPGSAMAIMGSEKASDVANNAMERGLSSDQIALESVASGLSTALTEKIPFDKMLGNKVSRSAFGQIASSFLAEGGQEMSEDILDALFDKLIAGDKSELAMQSVELQEQGMPKGEAEKTVNGNFIKQMLLDGLAGGISGGVLGGINAGANAINQRTLNNANVQLTNVEQKIPTLPKNENIGEVRPTQLELERLNQQNNKSVSVNESGLPMLKNNSAVNEEVETPKAETSNETNNEVKSEVKNEVYYDKNYNRDNSLGKTITSVINQYGGNNETKAELFKAMNEYDETGNVKAYDKAIELAKQIDSEMSGKTYKNNKGKVYYYDNRQASMFEMVDASLEKPIKMAYDANSKVGNELHALKDSAKWKQQVECFVDEINRFVETADYEHLDKAIEEYQLQMGDDIETRNLTSNIINEAVATVQNNGPLKMNLQFFNEDNYNPKVEEAILKARENNNSNPKTKANKALVDGDRRVITQTALNTLMNSNAYKNNADYRAEIDDAMRDGSLGADILRDKDSLVMAQEMIDTNRDDVLERIFNTNWGYEVNDEGQIEYGTQSKVLNDAAHLLIDEMANEEDFDPALMRDIAIATNMNVGNAAQLLQSQKKWSGTVGGALIDAQRVIDKTVERTVSNSKKERLNKVAQALNNMSKYDATQQKPKADITLEEAIEMTEKALGKEAGSIRKTFSDEDIEFIANKVVNGASVKELTQILTQKVGTGKFQISDEDIAKVNELYREANEKGLNSKEGFKCTEQAASILAKYATNDIGSGITTWRYMCMLMNPKTHIRNVVSNTAFGMVKSTSDTMAGAIESLMRKSGKLNGGERSVLTVKDRLLISGCKDDFDTNAYREYASAGSKYNEQDSITGKIKQLPKALNKAADLNGALLEIEDIVAGKNAYAKALARYLKANGKTLAVLSSQKKSDMNFADRARQFALKEANVATFHEKTKLSKFLAGVNAQGKDIPIFKQIMDGLLPFKTTPVNIAKQFTVDYNPLALPFTLAYDKSKSPTGHLQTEQTINRISKSATGTGLILLGMLARSAGLISGKSDEEDKGNINKGTKAYALNIGDYSYTLDWLSPIGTVITSGVALYDRLDSNGYNIESVIEALGDAGGNFFEASFLQGFDNLLSAIQYTNDKSTGGRIKAAASQLGSNYAGQFIPTLSGKIANTFDGSLKDSYHNKSESDLVSFGKSQINKIPGLRSTLPNSIDKFGNEKKQVGSNAFERAFFNFLSPGNITKKGTTDIEKEFSRLGKVVEDEETRNKLDKVFKTPTQNINGERIYGKEYEEYSKELGKTRYNAVNELIKSEEYINATDEEKIDMLSKLGNSILKQVNDKRYGADDIKKELAKQAVTDGTFEYSDDVSNIVSTVDKVYSTATDSTKGKYVAENYKSLVKDEVSQNYIETNQYDKLYQHLENKKAEFEKKADFKETTGFDYTVKYGRASENGVSIPTLKKLKTYDEKDDKDLTTKDIYDFGRINSISSDELGKLYESVSNSGELSEKAQTVFETKGYKGVAEYYKIKYEADANGNGTVSKPEFKDYAKRIGMNNDLYTYYYKQVYGWKK